MILKFNAFWEEELMEWWKKSNINLQELYLLLKELPPQQIGKKLALKKYDQFTQNTI